MSNRPKENEQFSAIAKRFIYRKERFITKWLKLIYLTEEY